MTRAEEKHIDAVGLDKFDAVAAQAMFRLKMDGRLRAAVKLREELAYRMALRATGFKDDAFSLATKAHERKFGAASHEMQSICDEFLNSVEVVE